MLTGVQETVVQNCHLFAENVMHKQATVTGIWQLQRYRCRGIEGVGVVLMQSEFGCTYTAYRHRHDSMIAYQAQTKSLKMSVENRYRL